MKPTTATIALDLLQTMLGLGTLGRLCNALDRLTQLPTGVTAMFEDGRIVAMWVPEHLPPVPYRYRHRWPKPMQDEHDQAVGEYRLARQALVGPNPAEL